MARLHEYQGKAILAANGFKIPRGRAASTADELHSGGLIVERAGKPAAASPAEEFANKDSELLACDIECRLAEVEGFYLELDTPELGELIGSGPALAEKK